MKSKIMKNCYLYTFEFSFFLSDFISLDIPSFVN